VSVEIRKGSNSKLVLQLAAGVTGFVFHTTDCPRMASLPTIPKTARGKGMPSPPYNVHTVSYYFLCYHGGGGGGALQPAGHTQRKQANPTAGGPRRMR
jgi:hypothetical protein